MWFTGNRANFHDFRDERFTISYCNKWLKRSCRLVGFEACSSNFRKSRRLLSTPKIVNRKECLFFAVISTSSTNSCFQKRADIFFPELFRPKIEVCFRVLWSLVLLGSRNANVWCNNWMTTTFQCSSFDFENYDKYFIFNFFVQCPLFLLNYAQIFVTIL